MLTDKQKLAIKECLNGSTSKPKRKTSRKPKRKTSRKPKRKTSRKPKRKTSRKPKRKTSRKPKRKTSRKPKRNLKFKMKRKRDSTLENDRKIKPKYDMLQLRAQRMLIISDINANKQMNANKLNTKVYLDENNMIFVIVPNLRYSGRDIIKIGLELPGKTYTQAFYRSSGMNTKTYGTFMPFDGIGINRRTLHMQKIGSLFLDKSYVNTMKSDFSRLYELRENNVKIVNNGTEGLSITKFFERIGNCYMGLMSYLLGGPAWDKLTNSSQNYVRTYLTICTHNLIVDLMHTTEMTAEQAKLFLEELHNSRKIIQQNMYTFFSSYFFNIKLHNINLILSRPLDQSINIPDNIAPETFHMIVNDFVGEANTINNFNSPQLSTYQQELFQTNYNSRLPRYTSNGDKIPKIYPSIDIANKAIEMINSGQPTHDLGSVILNANLEPRAWLRELKRQRSDVEIAADRAKTIEKLRERREKARLKAMKKSK